MLSIVKFDLLVSFLILIQVLYILNEQKNKVQYLSKNWIDIFALIPFAFIAIFSPIYYILVILLFLVRIYALFQYMSKIRDIIKITRKTKLDYATIILLITLVFGSLLFYLVESPVNPSAPSIDSSIFFMIVSMTTVGYGNTVPVTRIGQLIAVSAIVVGIGYTGWVTAAMASSLVHKIRKEKDKRAEEQEKVNDKILEKLDKIEKELEEIKNNNI